MNNYYQQFAAAYVRGKGRGRYDAQPAFIKDLESLSTDDINRLFQLARENKWKLHRFKRNAELPRVRKVLGMLQALQPKALLDGGSGRGVFLWPLLDTFPDLAVHCVDILDHRVADINALQSGGIQRLSASLQSLTALNFVDNHFDVVTLLEVLEHIPDAAKAFREALRVTKCFLVVSVPSKPDENPEHIHLIDEKQIRQFAADLPVKNIKFDYVPNHMIALIRKK